MMRTALFALGLVLCASLCHSEVHHYEWVVEDWVVDFKRPTVSLKKPGDRQTPFAVPEANRKAAILVNGQYPGPQIEVYENDTISVNVINKMISDSTTIHWHG